MDPKYSADFDPQVDPFAVRTSLICSLMSGCGKGVYTATEINGTELQSEFSSVASKGYVRRSIKLADFVCQ